MITVPVAATRIAREIGEAEHSIADALVKTTALLHSAALARAAASDIDPRIGHHEIRRLSKSVDGLVTLRGDMMRIHGGLEQAGREVGIADGPKPWTTGMIEDETLAA